MGKNVRSSIVAILIGLIGFIGFTRSPRFGLLHTVDILQLVASGMCFGGALSTILRNRRTQ